MGIQKCGFYEQLTFIYRLNLYGKNSLGFMVFNATFINISVISWRAFLF